MRLRETGFTILILAMQPTLCATGGEPQPDQAVQTKIERVAKLLAEEFERRPEPTRADELTAFGKAFKELNGIPNATLIQQLAWYMSQSEERAYEGIAIYSELRASPRNVLEGLMPLFSDDELLQTNVLLRKSVNQMIKTVQSVDYFGYLYKLREMQESPPPLLIWYMLRRDASDAFFTLCKVWGDEHNRELVLSERIVADAVWKKNHFFAAEAKEVWPKAQGLLAEYAANKHWWVRLYAALRLLEDQEFETPALLERLEKDENKMVRWAAEGCRKRSLPPGAVDGDQPADEE